MKKQNSKKLFLNKKAVSVLRANEMAALKGGAGITIKTISGVLCDLVTTSFLVCTNANR
jgi:hypothetical protein